jgi:hypothetical protein
MYKSSLVDTICRVQLQTAEEIILREFSHQITQVDLADV